ncbi:MAG: 2Fe-2S iron-sulfur cluster-binding protein [Planctomycetota bacterium]
MNLEFILDDQPQRIQSEGLETLMDLLRDRLQIDAVPDCCGEGDCGACVLMIDGELAMACLVPAVQIHRRVITTAAGLVAADPKLAATVQALSESLDCSVCLPGFVAAAVAGAQSCQGRFDSDTFRRSLAGQLCPCGEAQSICRTLKMALSPKAEGQS